MDVDDDAGVNRCGLEFTEQLLFLRSPHPQDFTYGTLSFTCSRCYTSSAGVVPASQASISCGGDMLTRGGHDFCTIH